MVLYFLLRMIFFLYLIFFLTLSFVLIFVNILANENITQVSIHLSVHKSCHIFLYYILSDVDSLGSICLSSCTITGIKRLGNP